MDLFFKCPRSGVKETRQKKSGHSCPQPDSVGGKENEVLE